MTSPERPPEPKQPLTPDELARDILSLDPECMKVVVLIGENGTGKSTFLAKLAKDLTAVVGTAGTRADGETQPDPNARHGSAARGPVIAVANTPHDKFPQDLKSLVYLGQRDGNRYASNAIKGAFLKPANQITGRVRKVADVLRVMGYERTMGLALHDFDSTIGTDGAALQDGELENLLQRVRSLGTSKLAGTTTPVIWMDLENYNESKAGASLVRRLLAKEDALIASGAASGLRVILRKPVASGAQPSREIDLEAASSGEIAYLASMAWVSSRITERGVLLIDEPENSLHPKWQLRYIEHLHQLFGYECPLVVIASHSPLLLTGQLPPDIDVIAYRMTEGSLAHRIIDLVEVGLEEVSWKAFGVLPGQNQFLSGLLIDLINRYCRYAITLEETTATMDTLLKACADPQQAQVIQTFQAALKVARR